MILAEKRNMLRTLPPVVKLKTRDPEIDVHAGETTEIHLFLDRTKNFDGPMQISLVGETPPGLSIGSAEIPPGGIEAAISIQAAREWSHGAATNLRFRAVGQIDKTKLITEATIKIRRRPKVAKR